MNQKKCMKCGKEKENVGDTLILPSEMYELVVRAYHTEDGSIVELCVSCFKTHIWMYLQ